MTDVGAPYGRTPPKRSYDKVLVNMDWHDYLANLWQPGLYYATGMVVRPRRADATGFQYRCIDDGVSDRSEPQWSGTAGATIQDGSAIWVAEEISEASLRTLVSTNTWSCDSGSPSVVTLGTGTVTDLVFSVLVGGGYNGYEYEVKHRIVCANGEEKEGIAVVPVQDSAVGVW